MRRAVTEVEFHERITHLGTRWDKFYTGTYKELVYDTVTGFITATPSAKDFPKIDIPVVGNVRYFCLGATLKAE